MKTPNSDQYFVGHLEGPALSLLVVSVAGGVVSSLLVALRTALRLHRGTFGVDDGLMLGGLVIYIVDIVLASIGAVSGLGTLNSQLNATMQMNAMKYLMLWMILYTAALCLVKVSVCVTMMRISTPMRGLRIALLVLIGLTIATFLTTFIGILLLCRPVAANWDSSILSEGRGECSSVQQMLALSYTSTASTIITDLACAVLPIFILWHSQMNLSTKVLVAVFLSFGSFASVCTMIRTPYIDNYNRPTDNLAYHIAYIPLWSNIETAVGLIAGSLPSLRMLLSSSDGIGRLVCQKHQHKRENNELITIGGGGSTLKRPIKSQKWKKSSEEELRGVQGDWAVLEDGASGSETYLPR